MDMLCNSLPDRGALAFFSDVAGTAFAAQYVALKTLLQCQRPQYVYSKSIKYAERKSFTSPDANMLWSNFYSMPAPEPVLSQDKGHFGHLCCRNAALHSE